MSRQRFVFTADVVVVDEVALRLAAAQRAAEDMGEEEWQEMRLGLSDDILMLLDPGALHDAGISIDVSTCEEVT